MRVPILVVAVLGVMLGCSGPTQPPPKRIVYTPPIIPAAPRPVWLGCPGGQQRLYQEAIPIYQAFYESQGGILATQYTLCADGTFNLEFISGRYGVSDSPGSYSEADSIVTFSFASTWNVGAKLRGDTMFVEYSEAMTLSDFISGPYLLQKLP